MRKQLNELAFDEINQESAYWIGFLMSDGCISEVGSSKQISVHIGIEDIDHLYKFKKFLSAEHDVRTTKYGKSVQFSFCSNTIAGRLARFGVVPRKSLTAKVLELESNLDFWRGMVDGDGTVGVWGNSPHIQLCGSKDCVGQFCNFASRICETKAKPSATRTLWKVDIAAKKATNLISHLYKDATIYLARKFEKAKYIIEHPELCPGTSGSHHRPSAKLDWEEVDLIRSLKGAVTQKDIASRFGLHIETVGLIHRGKTWIR